MHQPKDIAVSEKTMHKKSGIAKNKQRRRRNKYWPWVILTMAGMLTAAIRFRLLEMPLERDEGEFAYIGQLILQGIPPYLEAVNMKLPGIYAVYALIMAIFGQTIAGIHLGLLIANLIAVVLLFLLVRHLFDDIAAVVAAAGYALLSVSPSVLGTQAHATQFIVPFALGGTLILLKAADSGKLVWLFLSGLLFGSAFIIKQHAVFFCVFAAIYFTLRAVNTRPVRWKRLIIGNIILSMGLALPFLITCAILYAAGVFAEFWFWTFTYAKEYVSLQKTVFEILMTFKANTIAVINSWALLWLFSGIGIAAVFWNEKAKSNRLFLISFTILSFLTICPGFYFRPHYFVTFLPAVALLAGVGLSASLKRISEKIKIPIVQTIPFLAGIAAFVFPLFSLGEFFFKATPVEASRMLYPANIFPESIAIAEYIKENTKRDDRIAVIGSEPQIYFYSHRKSAARYIYVYALTERHPFASQMQRDMIREIESAKPQYIVYVDEPSSWTVDLEADLTILKWSEKYLNQNYIIVGLITYNFLYNKYEIYWDEEAANKKPGPALNAYVLKRRPLF